MRITLLFVLLTACGKPAPTPVDATVDAVRPKADAIDLMDRRDPMTGMIAPDTCEYCR